MEALATAKTCPQMRKKAFTLSQHVEGHPESRLAYTQRAVSVVVSVEQSPGVTLTPTLCSRRCLHSILWKVEPLLDDNRT